MAITTYLSISTLNGNGLNAPVKRQMYKEDVVHIYHGILLGHKTKNESLPFVTDGWTYRMLC